MAKLVRIKSELKVNKTKAFWHMAFASFFAVLFACASFVMFLAIFLDKTDLHIAFPIMFLVLANVMLPIFIIKKKAYDILKAGVKGEQETYGILKKLPKDYTVITNPVIHNRGYVNELDFVVIGENGVFVVESKNYRGIITGKTSDQNWKQIKHGKKKVYEKEVKNPAKQAFRQGRRMAEMFVDIDISADVFSILYFVDSRSELKIIDDAETGVAIINNEKDLLDYIVNTKGRQTVDSSERTKIVRFFKK